MAGEPGRAALPAWQLKLLEKRGAAPEPPRGRPGSGSGRPAPSQSRADAERGARPDRADRPAAGSRAREAGREASARSRYVTERGEIVGVAKTQRAGGQFRADSSDAWRNREIRMGVSVERAGMTQGGGRRGYPRPYRLARSAAGEKPRPDDSDSSSEELRYGPGIVSRLKDRYISIAMRESAAGGRRPLRRVSSLEHMLNQEGGVANGSAKAAPDARRGRMDSMKRAKSMGDLASARPAEQAPAAAPAGPAATDGSRVVQRRDRKDAASAAAAADKIVIVEEPRPRPAVHPVLLAPSGRAPPLAEPPSPEDALPPPDTVKTVKRMFEPSPRRAGTTRGAAETRPVSQRPAADRAAPRVRRTSPVTRPATLTPRPGVTSKASPPPLKTSSTSAREKTIESGKGAARGPALKPFVTSTSSGTAVSPPVVTSGRRLSPAASPDALRRVERPDKVTTWGQLRQDSAQSETAASPPATPPVNHIETPPVTQPLSQNVARPGHSAVTKPAVPPVTQTAPRPVTSIVTPTSTQPVTPPVTHPATQPSSPSRQPGRLKPPLSREPSSEPGSPTSSPVRRQVGIIKPTRKTEDRDEFNRRKNTLNHVKNSVVEREIAVIGTEYLKRKDLEEPAPLLKEPPTATQEGQDAPPPALPPRKAVLEPKKTLPLTIDTAPPRPAPFQGIVLKPVPKSELHKPPPEPAPGSAPAPVKGSSFQANSGAPPAAPAVPPASSKPSAPTALKLASLPVSKPASVPASKSVPIPVSKPVPIPVSKPVPIPVSKSPSVTPEVVNRPAAAPPKQKWHQQVDSSMVFNFTRREDVPDYVEDDGLILRRSLPKPGDSGYVILPGFDPGQTCDDDLSLTMGPPSPCNVVFINADIIISGKSSLSKKPKTRKLAVSFNMTGPSTHEYPSEASMMVMETSIESGDSSVTNGRLGGLASYTPSKLSAGADFELGVSRHVPTSSAARTSSADDQDEFLKPADESETVAWSAETTSDMLF